MRPSYCFNFRQGIHGRIVCCFVANQIIPCFVRYCGASFVAFRQALPSPRHKSCVLESLRVLQTMAFLWLRRFRFTRVFQICVRACLFGGRRACRDTKSHFCFLRKHKVRAIILSVLWRRLWFSISESCVKPANKACSGRVGVCAFYKHFSGFGFFPHLKPNPRPPQRQ